MLRRTALALAACAAAGATTAAAAPALAADRPIVYAVVIDGLDGDKVTPALAPTITGLLRERGTLYRESRSVMVAETNPNHVAMMTGAYGATSGIPGNAFALYHPTAEEDSCKATGPTDLTKLPTLTSGENAECLLQPTFFEAVERQGDPDGLLTAFATGKPKLGRIFSGRRADGATWADFVWAPCVDGPADDDYCGDVPLNPVSGYALDDKTVMDQVLRTVRDGVGAAKRRPDFTFVNLHQVDSVGHATGAGPLYEQALTLADTEVRRLVDELKARGEWDRTVLVLLSDHAMDTTTTKITMTDRFTAAGVPAGDFLVVQNGSAAHVYLKDRTAPSRFALLKKLRDTAMATKGVAAAYYRESNPEDGGTAHQVPEGWRLAGGERTGDLVLNTQPGVALSDPTESSNPLPGNHGGGQTRDNFFAVTGGAAALRTADLQGTPGPLFDDVLTNPDQAENADLAATVSGLLGLAAPGGSQGRFLREAFDLGALPGAGRPAAAPLAVTVARRTSRSRVLRVGLRGAEQAGAVDVQRRRRGRWVRVARAATTLPVRVVVPRRGTERLRVRQKAASGVHGPWTTLRVPR